MKRFYFLAVCVLIVGCSKDLSRSRAESIITKHIAFSPVTLTINLGHLAVINWTFENFVSDYTAYGAVTDAGTKRLQTKA